MRYAAFLLTALTVMLPPLHAQVTSDVYKVELTMRDAADASAKAGRHYVILVNTQGAGLFKLGSREPVASASGQYTYVDTGVNIECRLQAPDASGRLQLKADIDLSSIVPQKTPLPNPVIAQLKFNVTALVPAGKRTIIASIDDPVNSRKFELEALITKAD